MQGLAEVGELLDHLRLSIRPWDERILESLSPSLTVGTAVVEGWRKSPRSFLTV